MVLIFCFFFLLVSPLIIFLSLLGLCLAKYAGEKKDIRYFAWLSIGVPIVDLICAGILWDFV